jgi:hypothetical protein
MALTVPAVSHEKGLLRLPRVREMTIGVHAADTGMPLIPAETNGRPAKVSR